MCLNKIMSEKTKIQWADDSCNFWRGCTKVSPGCANCYAEKNIGVKMSGIEWGKGKPRVKSKSAVADCLRWNKKPWVCDECGHANAFGIDDKEHKCIFGSGVHQSYHRRRVFSLSLGDWLDPEVPIEWLAEMLDTIRQCDQLIFILCTKRPEYFFTQLERVAVFCKNDFSQNWEGVFYFCERWILGNAPENVWLLTSVENQEMADKRIPELLKIPAVVRGLSLEPLLGPVNVAIHENLLAAEQRIKSGKRWPIAVDWLIIGGESGPNARCCNVDWIRLLVQQGKSAGVATFVKQLGSRPESDYAVSRDEWLKFIIDKKGGEPSEWPEDLHVREFPNL